MDAVAELILAYVDSVGGICLYTEMLDAVPGEHRRLIPAALRKLKAENELQKQNRVVNGTLRFEVFRPDKRP